LKRNGIDLPSSRKNLPKVVNLSLICHREDDDKFEKSVIH